MALAAAVNQAWWRWFVFGKRLKPILRLLLPSLAARIERQNLNATLGYLMDKPVSEAIKDYSRSEIGTIISRPISDIFADNPTAKVQSYSLRSSIDALENKPRGKGMATAKPSLRQTDKTVAARALKLKPITK